MLKAPQFECPNPKSSLNFLWVRPGCPHKREQEQGGFACLDRRGEPLVWQSLLNSLSYFPRSLCDSSTLAGPQQDLQRESLARPAKPV